MKDDFMIVILCQANRHLSFPKGQNISSQTYIYWCIISLRDQIYERLLKLNPWQRQYQHFLSQEDWTEEIK